MRANRLVLAVLLASLVSATAVAQMDMLPQIFRDLPPELQEGLPEQMTFAEYRQLNRNVDFFTMFMSIFVPGYGLFQVEHPELAWPVVGARLAGYGMMTGAIVLQWSHFEDLFTGNELPDPNFDRLLRNSFIFGGGVVVAGLSWAADVVLAYHIAKQEKDLVQYRYGIRSSLYGGARGGADAATDARYLRGLLSQQSDAAVVDELLAALPAYAARYPESEFAGDALFFNAMLHAENSRDAQALRFAVRAAYLYPRGEHSDDALRLVARLFERNRDWGLGYSEAVSISRLPAAEGQDARLLSAVERLAGLNSRVLREAALEEARHFLTQYANGSYLQEGLAITADLLISLDRPDEAAGYLAALAVGGPDERDVWPEYTVKLAELYLGTLSSPSRARMLLRAVVEEAPESEAAERARTLLDE
ncbi:MAG: tetratricopeptide repeat protein [Spirochaetota bacterium]